MFDVKIVTDIEDKTHGDHQVPFLIYSKYSTTHRVIFRGTIEYGSKMVTLSDDKMYGAYHTRLMKGIKRTAHAVGDILIISARGNCSIYRVWRENGTLKNKILFSICGIYESALLHNEKLYLKTSNHVFIFNGYSCEEIHYCGCLGKLLIYEGDVILQYLSQKNIPGYVLVSHNLDKRKTRISYDLPIIDNTKHDKPLHIKNDDIIQYKAGDICNIITTINIPYPPTNLDKSTVDFIFR